MTIESKESRDQRRREFIAALRREDPKALRTLEQYKEDLRHKCIDIFGSDVEVGLSWVTIGFTASFHLDGVIDYRLRMPDLEDLVFLTMDFLDSCKTE
jgi:hypothetical protein